MSTVRFRPLPIVHPDAQLRAYITKLNDELARAINGLFPVGVADGGTGLTAVPKGSLLYGSAANTLSALPLGPDGSVLTANGITGLPEWRLTRTVDPREGVHLDALDSSDRAGEQTIGVGR